MLRKPYPNHASSQPCPACNKYFNNIAALVAHWDSSNINNSGNRSCYNEDQMYKLGMYPLDDVWYYDTAYSIKTKSFSAFKTCTQCKQSKPYRFFTKLKPKLKMINDGHMQYCKTCMTVRQRIAFETRRQKRLVSEKKQTSHNEI